MRLQNKRLIWLEEDGLVLPATQRPQAFLSCFHWQLL